MPGKKETNKNKGKGSPADDALWRAAMSDVMPLNQKKSERPAKTARGAREILPVAKKTTPPPAGKGQGIDARTDERLKKGKMEIDGRLDLHGLRIAEAERALVRALQRFHEQGKRCVLVITGKGSRGGGKDDEWWEPRRGAIKSNISSWLSTPPLKDIVLRFYPAQPRDGGQGALYVLLRRKR